MAEGKDQMKLTRKDAIALVLVAFVGAVATAAIREWGWPMLDSRRVAIVVMAVVGVMACAVAGGGTSAAEVRPPRFEGALGAVAAVLHGAAGLVIVVGLIVPSAPMVVALALDVALLWVVGTVHHLVGPNSSTRGRARTPAAA
jgi:hypothetical protein